MSTQSWLHGAQSLAAFSSQSSGVEFSFCCLFEKAQSGYGWYVRCSNSCDYHCGDHCLERWAVTADPSALLL